MSLYNILTSLHATTKHHTSLLSAKHHPFNPKNRDKNLIASPRHRPRRWLGPQFPIAAQASTGDIFLRSRNGAVSALARLARQRGDFT